MLKFTFRLLAIAAILVAALLCYAILLPAGPHEEKLVQLKAGSSARHIAAELKKAGIIHSEYAFLLWHYLHGRRNLKAGEYAFDHPARLREVYDRIQRGDIFVHLLVIPEGYNIFDIAAAIEDSGLGRRDDFLHVAQTDLALIRDLDPQAPSLEGYLFPDTYRFTRTQSMHDIAAAMVHRFRQTAHEAGLPADLHSLVIMASIVEKETAADAERPEVASVFYNRLNRHMVMATDPTVIYAALLNGRYRGAIYRSDLQFDSPYNTYRRTGLPPGPICNPGKASLLAAMHPADTQYLYFVSDNHGHHNFSRTPEEHAKNVAAYRRAVAESVAR
ncbi:MAG TPA: endolytic transglycosylase MltG [Candidatus Limnocylindrales bacterium]|nr:endolytic transglycosylase MltG [Candidatus Limnocylindrales bacterium]